MKSDIKALNIKLNEVSERLEILENDLFKKYDKMFEKIYKELKDIKNTHAK